MNRILIILLLTACKAEPPKKEEYETPRRDTFFGNLREKCGVDEQCFIQAAEQDVKAGNVHLFIGGTMDDDFANYYAECLYVQKKVRFHGGCISGSEIDGYNQTVVRLVKQNDPHFFDSCEAQAERLSGKRSKLKGRGWDY